MPVHSVSMKIFLASLVLIAIAFLFLGINIFFRKGGRFPETEVGRNKKMREMGITCVKCDELKAWHENKRRRKMLIKPSELKIDMNNLK